MSQPAVSVAPTMPVDDVARLMLDRGVRAVAVVDADQRLTGLITETDLLMRNANLHFPSYLGILENLLPLGGDRNINEELRKVLGVTAGEVMTADVYAVGPQADLGEVAHEMVHKHMHAVPVIDGERRLEGMLFPSDVVRLIAADAAR